MILLASVPGPRVRWDVVEIALIGMAVLLQLWTMFWSG